MKEILQHLRCIKPSKDWDFNYQPQLVGRISEPSNSKSHKLPENLGWEPAGVLGDQRLAHFSAGKVCQRLESLQGRPNWFGTGSFPGRNLGSGSLPKAFKGFGTRTQTWNVQLQLECSSWGGNMTKICLKHCFRCWLYIKHMKPLSHWPVPCPKGWLSQTKLWVGAFDLSVQLVGDESLTPSIKTLLHGKSTLKIDRYCPLVM